MEDYSLYFDHSCVCGLWGLVIRFRFRFFPPNSLVVTTNDKEREERRREGGREGGWHRLWLRVFSLAINSGGGVCVFFDDQSTQQASNPRYSIHSVLDSTSSLLMSKTLRTTGRIFFFLNSLIFFFVQYDIVQEKKGTI